MKNFIKPLLSGIIIALFMVVIMLKVTMNFQFLIIAGIVLFFLSGLYNSKVGVHVIANATLQLLSYSVLFLLLIFPELPRLAYLLLLFFVAAILGLLFKKDKKKVLIGLVVFVAISAWFIIKQVPIAITKDLTFTKNEAMPSFILTDLKGNEISSSSLKGKVVVLDFFGTWCKPCIGELIELDKVQKSIASEDVVFYVVNADIGGDTPEKFKAFLKKVDYDFNYAYDYNSEIYKSLKLQSSGLPTLIIIDRNQNVRLHHIGFNPAETNFAEEITKFIKGLL